MPKISKRIVDATDPNPTGRRFVWDDVVKGFALVVMPTGAKSYVFQYRVAGQSRRIKLGTHGNITAEQARQLALDMGERIRRGEDPLREKRAARDALTVAAMLDLYVASEAFAQKAPTTRAIDLGRIARHLKPRLGRTPADAVTARDVECALRAIREGKTALRERTGRPRGVAVVKGGASAARDCIALLRAVYNWAIGQKLAKENPVAGIRLGSHNVRDTILQDADDYQRLFQTLEHMEVERRIPQAGADCIRIIALTGARKSEIAGLRWRDLDLKAGIIAIPPERHKSGKRTGKPRIISLPSAASAIIARQPEGPPDSFVFAPSRGDGGAIALSKLWQKVRIEAQLPDGIGLHGLRHSFGSHLGMSGATGPEIMAALGHARINTSLRYLHWQEDARRELAERGASLALAGLAASSGKKPAKVVRLRRGK